MIIGFCRQGERKIKFLSEGENVRQVENISPYLTAGPSIIVSPASQSICGLPKMTLGNVPKDDGGLLITTAQLEDLQLTKSQRARWIKLALGSTEFIQGKPRYCLWIADDELADASQTAVIRQRIEHVRQFRENSVDPGMAAMASKPHQFREMNIPTRMAIDETLERIYIGRRFKNDTERLEKLFELYTQMTSRQASEKNTGSNQPVKRKTKGADA